MVEGSAASKELSEVNTPQSTQDFLNEQLAPLAAQAERFRSKRTGNRQAGPGNNPADREELVKVTDAVTQDAPVNEGEEQQSQEATYTEAELKLTEKAQNLLNQRGRKYTIGADRVRAYTTIINDTEDFLKGVSKAEMRRIATGESRVPRALTDRYKDTYSGLKPHWHWLKGIIAVAVAMNYEPPKADPQPEADAPAENAEAVAS